MNLYSSYQTQAGGNFASVINYLNSRMRTTSVQLVDNPCYFLVGNKAKIEITVYSNPRVGTVDIRMMKLKNFDREPFFETRHDIATLSMPAFEREIENLISQLN